MGRPPNSTRAVFATVILAMVGLWAARESIVDASDWMFRRSYYSHDAEPADRDDWSSSRSAYREPWVGAHPHSAVRSGWRINSFVINSGSSTDQTFYRENWTDVNY